MAKPTMAGSPLEPARSFASIVAALSFSGFRCRRLRQSAKISSTPGSKPRRTSDRTRSPGPSLPRRSKDPCRKTKTSTLEPSGSTIRVLPDPGGGVGLVLLPPVGQPVGGRQHLDHEIGSGFDPPRANHAQLLVADQHEVRLHRRRDPGKDHVDRGGHHAGDRMLPQEETKQEQQVADGDLVSKAGRGTHVQYPPDDLVTPPVVRQAAVVVVAPLALCRPVASFRNRSACRDPSFQAVGCDVLVDLGR